MGDVIDRYKGSTVRMYSGIMQMVECSTRSFVRRNPYETVL